MEADTGEKISAGVRAFLDEPHFAVVSTIAADGMPHQTVMWYALDGDAILLNTPSGSLKDKHLRRDPRISICVEDGFRYVTITGKVEFIDDPATARADYGKLGGRYQSVMGQRPPLPANPDPKVAALLSRDRVGLRVTVERVLTNGL